MADLRLDWKAPGPVAQAFMDSSASVQGIQGPIGSGKTSAALMKIVFRAVAQKPSTFDGVRKFKACVVRDTYRQLWNTTIPSWLTWVPKEAGVWSGGKDNPAKHEITFKIQVGDQIQRVELNVEFVAIGDNRVEDVLRGYEVTMFYLNEADLLSEEVYTYARGRAGRYPKMFEGGPSWYGVIMDFNAPEFDSWLENKIINGSRNDLAYFCQPGGRDPRAENTENLPPDYYAKQMDGQPEWYIRRMVDNKMGYSRDGLPVFPEFNDQLHVSTTTIAPVNGLPILIGTDAGGTPAAVFEQRMSDGQWRTLAELTTEKGTTMGPTSFGEAVNRLLKEKFPGFEYLGSADPSSTFGGDENDKAWLSKVCAVTKIDFQVPRTNALTPRLEAVRLPLTRMIDGDKPGHVLSPDCRILRKAMNNGYQYKRMKITNTDRYSEEPDKNEYSHPMDAMQYNRLVFGEYEAVLGRQQKQQDRWDSGQSHAITDDDPDGILPRRGFGRRQKNIQTGDYYG